jgi:IS30 family transposase
MIFARKGIAFTMPYSELSVEERATIQIGHAQSFSLRKIACMIN